MNEAKRKSHRRGRNPIRRIALLVAHAGFSTEFIAIVGMILGILAGVSFLLTTEASHPNWLWGTAAFCCLLRLFCINILSYLTTHNEKRGSEYVFLEELPERVSDAVTLLGFGFALNASPWLGLAAALCAIFSAYVRSIGFSRGAGRKPASSGPMTRSHRLLLLSITSVLIILGVNNEKLGTTIPQIALWVIIVGCVATILIRWLNIREIDNNRKIFKKP